MFENFKGVLFSTYFLLEQLIVYLNKNSLFEPFSVSESNVFRLEFYNMNTFSYSKKYIIYLNKFGMLSMNIHFYSILINK